MLPSELAKLAGHVCATKKDPDDKILVFAWDDISDENRRELVAAVFNDSTLGRDFKSLIARDKAGIHWKSTTCVPFAMTNTTATKFNGVRTPQFDRLLLVDTKGAVFEIEVDGTAINRPEPTKLADRWQDLDLEKRDAAFLAKIKAATKSQGDVKKVCTALIAKAEPLLAKRDYAGALKILEPEMRERQPLVFKPTMGKPSKSAPTFEACTAVGGAFDRYGQALWGVGRKDDALAAFRNSYECGGKYGNQSFTHCVVALVLLGKHEDAAAFETENGASDYIKDMPEILGWIAELGAVDVRGVQKVAKSKSKHAESASSILQWLR